MPFTRRRMIAAGSAAALAGCSPPGAAVSQETQMSDSRPLATRTIPSTGEALPMVGLGTYVAFDIAASGADWDEAREGLRAFVGRGGRVVDSSPMYGRAEDRIGTLSEELKARASLFLATKVWTRGREAGIAQMEASFAKLRAEKVDLMQVHNLLDLDVHMATLRAWKEQGRIRYLGVTHYHEGAYDALEAAMRRYPLDFIQINASVAEREAETRVLPLARERGMGVLINRPFAGGDVFSRVRRQPLPVWAGELGCTSWAQILLKYVLANPAVTCAIPGTRNPRHILDNLGAATEPLPDAAQRARIVQAVEAA
jgi:diketogulonate reductase-like aldo/keto reductase